MQDILIGIQGADLDYELARDIARLIALRGEPETSLVACFDAKEQKHSPRCVQCEIGDRPGWEVYGVNHGGRLRIVFNNREYVFIYS